jgi:pantothenate kinase
MGKAQLLKLPRKFPLPEQTPPVIALAGNPNTGKSTIFNLLTGTNKHTGNWPGKTVLLSSGSYYYQRQDTNWWICPVLTRFWPIRPMRKVRGFPVLCQAEGTVV